MKKKEQKREEAKTRQEKANALTPVQRIEKLDKQFGKNVGAKKERIKLEQKISK